MHSLLIDLALLGQLFINKDIVKVAKIEEIIGILDRDEGKGIKSILLLQVLKRQRQKKKKG